VQARAGPPFCGVLDALGPPCLTANVRHDVKTAPASFAPLVRSALESSGVVALLARGWAIVLERIACGAGATRWYLCRDKHALAAIEKEFSPGSLVSFYVDERIRSTTLSPAVRAEIDQIAARDHDAVVGVLKDEIHLCVEFVSSSRELDEFGSAVGPGAEVFVGAFPGRDNDGLRAVTVTLPDVDGTVRRHPY
jgi:hypothetical protein